VFAGYLDNEEQYHYVWRDGVSALSLCFSLLLLFVHRSFLSVTLTKRRTMVKKRMIVDRSELYNYFMTVFPILCRFVILVLQKYNKKLIKPRKT